MSDTQPPVGSKTAIIISGMHRSGTSALTRVISLMGAVLPATLIPGRAELNDADYWEGRAIVDLNQRLIHTNGTWWAGWQRLYSDRLSHRDEFLAEAREVISAEFKGADLIALKDPRVSRLIPFWTDALAAEGYRTVHVIALRDPAHVAASLERRDGLTPKTVGLGWIAHMLDAEEYTRQAPRVVVSLDNLVSDWRREMDRIEKALGVEWPVPRSMVADEIDSFIDPELAHRSAVKVPLVSGLYRLFTRWAEDDVRPRDEQLLDRWHQHFDPARSVRSSTSTLRRRGGAELAGVTGWRAIEHTGYQAEAQQAFAWLVRERQHAKQVAQFLSQRRVATRDLKATTRELRQTKRRVEQLEAQVATLTAPKPSLPRRVVRRALRPIRARQGEGVSPEAPPAPPA